MQPPHPQEEEQGVDGQLCGSVHQQAHVRLHHLAVPSKAVCSVLFFTVWSEDCDISCYGHVYCCDAHVMPGVLIWPDVYSSVQCLILAGALKVAWQPLLLRVALTI